jgi:hypothetical protein
MAPRQSGQFCRRVAEGGQVGELELEQLWRRPVAIGKQFVPGAFAQRISTRRA